MKLEETQSKIAAITFSANPHSKQNRQELDSLFLQKRTLLNKLYYGEVALPAPLHQGKNKYE
jgi:hypothetical protein